MYMRVPVGPQPRSVKAAPPVTFQARHQHPQGDLPHRTPPPDHPLYSSVFKERKWKSTEGTGRSNGQIQELATPTDPSAKHTVSLAFPRAALTIFFHFRRCLSFLKGHLDLGREKWCKHEAFREGKTISLIGDKSFECILRSYHLA